LSRAYVSVYTAHAVYSTLHKTMMVGHVHRRTAWQHVGRKLHHAFCCHDCSFHCSSACQRYRYASRHTSIRFLSVRPTVFHIITQSTRRCLTPKFGEIPTRSPQTVAPNIGGEGNRDFRPISTLCPYLGNDRRYIATSTTVGLLC